MVPATTLPVNVNGAQPTLMLGVVNAKLRLSRGALLAYLVFVWPLIRKNQDSFPSSCLPKSTDDEGRIADVVIKLMRLELKEPRPVRLVGVGGQNLLRSPKQLDLLDPSVNRRDDLNRVADAVRARFGAGKLRRGGEL